MFCAATLAERALQNAASNYIHSMQPEASSLMTILQRLLNTSPVLQTFQNVALSATSSEAMKVRIILSIQELISAARVKFLSMMHI